MSRNAISRRILKRYAEGERVFNLDRDDGDYYLDGVTLTGASFSGSSIFGSFRNANLEGADFSDCNVKTCDFSGSNLRGACFRGSVIDAAIFTNAKLDGADFEDAGEQGYDYKAGELPLREQLRSCTSPIKKPHGRDHGV